VRSIHSYQTDFGSGIVPLRLLYPCLRPKQIFHQSRVDHIGRDIVIIASPRGAARPQHDGASWTYSPSKCRQQSEASSPSWHPDEWRYNLLKIITISINVSKETSAECQAAAALGERQGYYRINRPTCQQSPTRNRIAVARSAL
jgi:hypothetical protein